MRVAVIGVQHGFELLLEIDVECLPCQIGQFFGEPAELALLFKLLDCKVLFLLFEGCDECLLG